MAEADKNSKLGPRVSEAQRMQFIGFDIPGHVWWNTIATIVVVVGLLLFYGWLVGWNTWWCVASSVIFIITAVLLWRYHTKSRDLFKSEAEKNKYLKQLADKRDEGQIIREHCTLTEERVSLFERLVLTIASLAILAALFLPWYSAYSEVEEEVPVAPVEVGPTHELIEQQGVVAMVLTPHKDSVSLWQIAQSYCFSGDTAATSKVTTVNFFEMLPDSATDIAESEYLWATYTVDPELAEGNFTLAEGRVWEVEPVETEDVGEAAAETAGQAEAGAGAGESQSRQEIITGHTTRKQLAREYSHLTGFGTFAALGPVGGPVFSSGIVLVLSAVLMLVLGILCVLLPIINLYSIFGAKGTPDQKALMLKKYLKLNWLPAVILTVVIALSFVGANYGFDTTASFKSIGDGYSIGVLLGSLSWGVFVALAASLVVAVKGIEI